MALSSEQVSNMRDKKSKISTLRSDYWRSVSGISGVKLYEKVLRKFRQQLKNAENNGSKICLETAISHVIEFRKIFQTKQIVGGTYQPKRKIVSKRVTWVDQESAFSERMRTGLVVNIKHKDVGEFLDDAFVLMRRRVHNIFKVMRQ